MNYRLIAFLYLMLRDQLPAGVIEKIMVEQVDTLTQEPKFSNPHLEAYARELSERLLK